MVLDRELDLSEERMMSHDEMIEWFEHQYQNISTLEVLNTEYKVSDLGQLVKADMLVDTFRGEECIEVKRSKNDAKYRLEGQIMAYKRAGYYTSIFMYAKTYDKFRDYIDGLCKIHNCSLYLLGNSLNIERVNTGSTHPDGEVSINNNSKGWKREMIDGLN